MTNGKQLKTHSEIVNLIAIDSSHLGSINVGLSLQTLITVLYICMAIIFFNDFGQAYFTYLCGWCDAQAYM